MSNDRSNKKNVSRFNKIIKPGDLIKILNTAANSAVFWFITEDKDVKACMLPGPVLAMYIGLWIDQPSSVVGEWHLILFDNKILITDITKIRKIKL